MVSSVQKKGSCILLALLLCGANLVASLADLARPIEGRSMRSTSTHTKDGKPDPDSNHDNSNVKPGQTAVLLDVKGPGVITHIWITFLAPEPHPWAKNGSANHQEMVLRMYWDGSEVPAVETPLGDFFANSFGRRSEVISMPVIVEDADSYNCFWNMPFRKSARIEIENQSPTSPSACCTTTSTGSRKTASPKTRRISTPATVRNIPPSRARTTSFSTHRAKATMSAQS